MICGTALAIAWRSLFPLYRLAQIMGYDSLDTTKLYILGTKQDLQQAVETIAWT
jgi:hypothetical protein